MRIGDLVEVIDEGSSWYHFKGRIVDLTRAGLIAVELRGLRIVFEPHQLEDDATLPDWPRAA